PRFPPHSVDECMARQAMETSHLMPIAAIASLTQSGNTVLYMSRHLTKVPIYALTPLAETAGRVTLFRNVIPKPISADYGETEAPQATRDVVSMMLYDKLVEKDDLIIMTLGTPMGKAGGTNTMKIVRVGEVFNNQS
ncbi:MAG: pyruvate kinase, partial [Mariprofundaceae bacterium]|nr:pyruvate kinase [Mariprofundaceae bacterium]